MTVRHQRKRASDDQHIVIIVLAVIGVLALGAATALDLLHDDAQPFIAIASACIGSLTTMVVQRDNHGSEELEQFGRDTLAGMLRQITGVYDDSRETWHGHEEGRSRG